MPNIKGIDLSDGVNIISGEINLPDAWYDRNAIQNYLEHHTIEECEDDANAFLENHLSGEQVRIHIFSVDPLNVTCIVANAGVDIPDNWWEV